MRQQFDERWDKNVQCGECGKNALAVYVRDDGTERTYCHACGNNSSYKGSTKSSNDSKPFTWPPIAAFTGSHATHEQIKHRNISRNASEKYDVRCYGATVCFPCYWQGKVTGYKARDFSVPKKEQYHMLVRGSYKHMIGWQTVHTKKHLGIALGEFDALSVYDATGIPCISAPSGDGSLVSTIKRDYRLFEGFERIVFMLDKDGEFHPSVKQPSEVAAEAADILGVTRCYIAAPVYDDPNAYLMEGKSGALKSLFWSAVPASADMWHSSSRDLIMPVELGRLTGWEEFDKRVRGLRMCETTYLIGAPGTGKTTLLCWLMWLMSQRGINMAALVLEGSVSQFVTKLSNTFYGGNIFSATDDELNEVSEAIDKHIVFAKEPEKIELAIRTAVVQHDVEVVVVDNITAISNPDEVYASTSNLVTMFDQLAAELAIHIIVLSHVKVQYFNEKPELGAASGSSGIERKAYNLLALHGRKEVGLLKCRQYGEQEGWWDAVFDVNASRYVQGARMTEWKT